MFVRPVAHPDDPDKRVIVRHPPPNFGKLADEGAHVPETRYWIRRLARGDVEKAEPPEAEAPVVTITATDKATPALSGALAALDASASGGFPDPHKAAPDAPLEAEAGT